MGYGKKNYRKYLERMLVYYQFHNYLILDALFEKHMRFSVYNHKCERGPSSDDSRTLISNFQPPKL